VGCLMQSLQLRSNQKRTPFRQASPSDTACGTRGTIDAIGCFQRLIGSTRCVYNMSMRRRIGAVSGIFALEFHRGLAYKWSERLGSKALRKHAGWPERVVPQFQNMVTLAFCKAKNQAQPHRLYRDKLTNGRAGWSWQIPIGKRGIQEPYG
jgi:hypothetical protein